MDRNQKFFKFEVTSSHFKNIESHGTKVSKSSNLISIDFFPPLVEPVLFQLDEKSLKIIGDRMGTTPVYVQILDDRVYCSSHISKLNKEGGGGLHLDPIEEFINSGLILEDQTIWKGIFKVSPKYHYTIDFKKQPFTLTRTSHQPISKKTPSDWSQLLDQFKQSLDKVISASKSGLFALSGGADTRLLLALMDEKDRKSLTFYTKAHPNIGDGRDKDVEIAKSLAQSFDLKHHIIENPKIYLAFLIPEFTSGKVISGLYGGEILGLIKPSSLGVEFKEDQASIDWVRALLNTSRSMVYDQLDYGWATPHSLLYFTDTPFIDPDFIDLVFAIDENDNHEYQLYSKLWQKPPLNSFLDKPFSSPITSVSSQFQGIEGPEPKLIPSPYQLEVNSSPKYKEDLEEISKKLTKLNDKKLRNLQFYIAQTGTEDPYGLI